ncbi:MAG: ACP S-malonyltransferase [Pseudomonadales bacterium]|nr:ACP S-malonyltransferase [Pseudomonadales bacterium]
MAHKFAILFPGQGSQSVGMLADYAEQNACVIETFEEASDALGYDMWGLIQNGPMEELNRTEVTQPIMLVAGVAIWRVWLAKQGRKPDVMAGHSLGEYTALVCSEAIGLGEAAKLVRLRGRFMQDSVPEGHGSMAAIIGLDDRLVEQICKEASGDEVVSCANYNSPGQIVIGGNKAAVDRASALAKSAKARVMPVAMSVPSHCWLMKPAAEKLEEELGGITLRRPNIPIINNVDAKPEVDSDLIKSALIRQVYNPVGWVSVIRTITSSGVTHMLECGPGKVLSGLSKRIDKSLIAYPMSDIGKFEKAHAAVLELASTDTAARSIDSSVASNIIEKCGQ